MNKLTHSVNSTRITFIILFLITIAGILCSGLNPYTYITTNIISNSAKKTIVIDPGHGGYDPGKVGVLKTLEKDINLAIALQLEKELKANNIDVVMTRTEDIDYSTSGTGSKKVNDLNSRINIINEAAPEMVISIHQNSFGDSSVKGAQVFYYGDEKNTSYELANSIQTSLISDIDSNNHRTPKSNTSYYMLKKTKYPTVIVECGFLSNAEEEKKLGNTDYQNQVAKAICHGILNYLLM